MVIAKKLVSLAKQLGVKKNFVVINKVVDVVETYQLFSRVFADMRSDVEMHMVRFDEAIVKLENAGEGLQKLGNDSIAYRDVGRIADRIEKMM